VVALIDSGSSITTIRGQFARLLRLQKRATTPLNVTFGDNIATTVTKHESSAIMTIGSYVREVSFRVIEDLAFDVILGTNWLRKHAMDCSWKKNLVKLPTGECVPMLRTRGPRAVQLGMTASQTEQMRMILSRYKHVFAVDPKRPNRIDFIQHRIDTGDHQPFKIYPRRRSPMERERINNEVRRMLADGIVVESDSPFASPSTLVNKKTGDLRFCGDYRKLNTITRKDSFPLPRVDDCLDQLGKAKFFSTLDLASGYWQIPIHPDDRHKTAFQTEEGLYEFVVMPFGLTNAPATFQRAMNHVFRKAIGKFCVVYLDDINIYSETWEEHLLHVERILQLLAQYGFSLKASKCNFGCTTVDFLGYSITPYGLQPMSDKVSAITNYPRPKDKREVQSFLGLCGFYRKFIPRMSDMATPLQRLATAKKFEWTRECETSFAALRAALTDQSVLAFPDFTKPFAIHTDASNVGLGAALTQWDDKMQAARPVAFASRTLSETERRYSTIERECLALVWAMHKFHPYVHGTRVTVHCDHNPLQALMSKNDPYHRLARWQMDLQGYDFKIAYRRGIANKDADALSRAPMPASEKEMQDTLSPILSNTASSGVVAAAATDQRPAPSPTPSLESIRRQQRADPTCREIRDLLTKEPRSEKETRRASYYRDVDDILYFMPSPEKADERQIVVPAALRPTVMHAFHDHPLAGHMGTRRTYDRIKRSFYWNTLHSDVRKYVESCVTCAQHKPRSTRAAGTLSPIQVSAPFELVGMDIMGPLPESVNGNRFIIVAVDYLTRWCEVGTLATATAENVAKFFLDEVVARHGCPQRILTDNASNFTAEMTHHMYKTLGVRISHSTPYHPETNGLVERLNRTLKTMINMYIREDQRDWDTYLPFLTFAYHTATQESTGVSPFEAIYGRRAKMPPDTTVPPAATPFASPTEWQRTLRERLAIIRRRASQQQTAAQDRQRRIHDATHAPSQFKVKDLVVIADKPTHQPGRSTKLMQKFSKPFELIQQIGPLTFIARELDNPRPLLRNVHVSQLKRIHQRTLQPPPWRGSDVTGPLVHLTDILNSHVL
jgi:transposase InsO family protein